jgi:hypothetical protein
VPEAGGVRPLPSEEATPPVTKMCFGGKPCRVDVDVGGVRGHVGRQVGEQIRDLGQPLG